MIVILLVIGCVPLPAVSRQLSAVSGQPSAGNFRLAGMAYRLPGTGKPATMPGNRGGAKGAERGTVAAAGH